MRKKTLLKMPNVDGQVFNLRFERSLFKALPLLVKSQRLFVN